MKNEVHISPFEQMGRTAASKLSPADSAILDSLLADEDFYYVDDEAFHKDGAEEDLFAEAIELEGAEVVWNDIYIRDDEKITPPAKKFLLTRQEERIIFLQFNYARFRVAQLHAHKHLSFKNKKDIIKWYALSNSLRETILVGNLGLSIAMAKKFKHSNISFEDMVAEGNVALMRAVNKFNIGRGSKFSTYACRAILKGIARAIKGEQKFHFKEVKGKKGQQDRTVVISRVDDAEFNLEDPALYDPLDRLILDDLLNVVGLNLADLSHKEQIILHRRFPLSPGSFRGTLQEVGASVGVTKERIRQIQNKVLDKLGDAMDDERALAK